MWFAAVGFAAPAFAQEVAVSAKVDKTTVDVGSPIQLTVTLHGDLAGVQLQPLEFPPKFVVAARSQATNLTFRAGVQERSTELLYVLVPQEAGTFKLGPFTCQHGKQAFQTEPITITVKKSVLPPNLPQTEERYTL